VLLVEALEGPPWLPAEALLVEPALVEALPPGPPLLPAEPAAVEAPPPGPPWLPVDPPAPAEEPADEPAEEPDDPAEEPALPAPPDPPFA